MLESKGFVFQAKKMAADWKLPEGWAVKLGKDGRLIKAGTTWQKLVGMRYWETTRKNMKEWNEMERDGTRWNEHVMRAANSIIQQVLEESLLVDTLTWHDFPWLSRRWMVLVRRRFTTPRQHAVNLAVARQTFSFFFSLIFLDRFFDWILVRKRLWKLQKPRCNGEYRINMDKHGWYGWTWWTQVGHVGKCGASCTDGSCEAQKKVEEAKAAHQQMLSAQALPKMDRQEFSYSCGSKTKIFIDFHKKKFEVVINSLKTCHKPK